MRPHAPVACLLAMAALAGCATAGPGGGLAPNQDEVPIRVLAASLQPGRCFDGATAFGDTCHVLQVELDNRGYTNDRSTNGLSWKATDSTGRVHAFALTGRDSVRGGAAETLSVSFTVPDGPARLAELRYDTFAGRGDSPVPPY